MSASGGLLLGVDVGTSSTKGVLARPDGEVVATAERPHELSLPRPGWAEHDAESVWWADFVAICADLVPRAGGAIAALCISGIGPCLLPADAAGRPLRPAILYADTRARAELALMNEQLAGRDGPRRTAQDAGPKII